MAGKWGARKKELRSQTPPLRAYRSLRPPFLSRALNREAKQVQLNADRRNHNKAIEPRIPLDSAVPSAQQTILSAGSLTEPSRPCTRHTLFDSPPCIFNALAVRTCVWV